MSDSEVGVQDSGFGNRLRALRRGLDLTQRDFGQIVGLTQTYISNLELGDEQPTKRFIKQICSQFHVREEWLVNGDGSMEVSIEELMAPVLEAINARGPFAFQEVRAILAMAHPVAVGDTSGGRTTDPSAIVAELSLQELRTARSLHGPLHGRHEGYACILEELDELWDECKKRDPDPRRMRREATQVAATAMRFVLDVCPLGGES